MISDDYMYIYILFITLSYPILRYYYYWYYD